MVWYQITRNKISFTLAIGEIVEDQELPSIYFLRDHDPIDLINQK
jgi:hypothetical protein